MKRYNHLYKSLYSYENLYVAYKKARKGKSKKSYVLKFESHLNKNINKLKNELAKKTYFPKPLKQFIIRDPKTRIISRSYFRDRIVHHALVNILNPIFDKSFIYDSYASRKNKGYHKAIQRFDYFKRKISKNGKKLKGIKNNNYACGYILKIDIKHYFETIDHNILVNIIRKRIKEENVIWLINKILRNNIFFNIGLPFGNYTSQFFANVYLNELDKFAKHKLKIKYYIRYVDDIVILSDNKEELEYYFNNIISFLKSLKLEIHANKSRIIPLHKGVPLLGFRVFYYYKLLKKNNFELKIKQWRDDFDNKIITFEKLLQKFNGLSSHAKFANTYNLRKRIYKKLVLNIQ